MEIVNRRYYGSEWDFHEERLDDILRRPEAYIGSVDKCNRTTWVYEEDEDGGGKGKMVKRSVSYAPGLLRIFNEILVDVITQGTITLLKLSIDVGKNEISIYLDGKGVPVDLMSSKKNIYYPEFLVSRLYTPSWINDTIPTTGPRLTNIFSTQFQIETADGVRLFKQVFENNMRKRKEPQVTKCERGENWTKFTFKPDLSKFNMTHLEDDVVALMKQRVIDVAGCHGVNCVELNGNKVSVGTFSNLVDLYLQSKSKDTPLPRFTERVNECWEIGVCLSDQKFEQVSFVNGFSTINGGTHVDHVRGTIAHLVKNLISKEFKHTKGVLGYLWVFVNARISDPTFDSAGNETLTNLACFYKCRCDELPQDFSKKLEESGVVARVKSFVSSRSMKWFYVNRPKVARHSADQGPNVVIGQSTGELKNTNDDATVITNVVIRQSPGERKRKLCAMEEGPGFGENWKSNLQDVVAFTGNINTTGVKFEKFDLEMIGTCKKVIISKVYTVIIGGSKKALEGRFKQIKSAVEESTSDCDLKELEKRLAKLSCRLLVLKMGAFGGASEAEVGEKDRVTHACQATKAAVEEGGGVTLRSVSRELDKLSTENNDIKPHFPLQAVFVGTLSEQENLDLGYYDAAEGEYVDMVKAGNMDPVKVIKTAVEESTSDCDIEELEERLAKVFGKEAECS